MDHFGSHCPVTYHGMIGTQYERVGLNRMGEGKDTKYRELAPIVGVDRTQNNKH